jgi:uncharacterized protein (DUF1330 family)
MATYMVFTRLETTDGTKLEEYFRQGPATLEGHDATVHVAYGAHAVLEGPAHEGVVILSFPSSEAALAWYNGEDYRRVRDLRLEGADYQVTLVEGG